MAERPPGMKVFVSNAADIGGGGSGGLTDAQLRASAVPVSMATVPTGGATSAKQDTQITAEQAILAKIIAAPSTEAKQDTTITDLGGVTETAPATDTSSSGLNGRLQRVAQRITSLIALLPTALGANGGLKIEGVASGTVVPISGTVTANNTAATTVVSTALEASHVLKGSAGSLISITWFNSKASAQYLLVMNSATVPADGAVTLLLPPILMAANSTGQIDFKNGLVASTGISISNSSTGSFTKTIGGADCAFTGQVI